jgi:hypothetical protein
MKQSTSIATALLLASSLLSACAPTQLMSRAAADVKLTHNEPPGECAFLGDVTGNQGDSLSGPLTSNADLETGARNDIKNKAAAMGGNVIYLLTQRAGRTGAGDHREQTNVTLSGNVYHCPMGTIR